MYAFRFSRKEKNNNTKNNNKVNKNKNIQSISMNVLMIQKWYKNAKKRMQTNQICVCVIFILVVINMKSIVCAVDHLLAWGNAQQSTKNNILAYTNNTHTYTHAYAQAQMHKVNNSNFMSINNLRG